MTELPSTKTALESIILKAYQGISQAARDQKNCTTAWASDYPDQEQTLAYMNGKLSGIREALTILDLEISNAPK